MTIPAYRRYGERDDSLDRYVSMTTMPGADLLTVEVFRESEDDFALQVVILDQQNRVVCPPSWRVRLAWADVRSDNRARPSKHPHYGAAQSWPLEKALRGIENIRASGFAYQWWVEDDATGRVISPTFATGFYENHAVLGAVLRVNVGADAAPGAVDVDAVTDAVIRRVGVTMVDMGRSR